MVMSGTGGVGESPQAVIPNTVRSTQLQLQTSLGYVKDDVVLLANQQADPVADCVIDQVGDIPAGQVLPLGGTYHRDNSGSYGADSIALQLGRSAVNPPQFNLYGVGANRTLVSYDLLQPAPADAQISDGIVEMRALYGLDTTNPPDGILDTWVDATGSYAASALTDGTSTAQTRLRQIVAVRVGLILRTALQERAPATSSTGVVSAETFGQATGTTLTLFSDLPTALRQTRTLTAAELNYRFRTVEVTIPLRNVLLAP